MNKFIYKIKRTRFLIKFAVSWRRPRYLLKATKNVILHKLGLNKGFMLHSLCLAITYSCNYNCPFCFTQEMLKKRKQEPYLTVEDYKRIAKQAIKMGAISFGFQGGEIWLHKDFKEIIKAFKPKRHFITITTNGTLVTEDRIKELVHLGVNKMLFSLESGIAEEHDKNINRSGGFEATMKAVNLALKNKRIQVGINITLSKLNLYSGGFKKLIEFCDKHGILLNIIFGCALGKWKEYRNLMLSSKDIEYYNKNIVPLSPYLNRHLNFNYNGRYGCPGAKEHFYINPWGDVLACPFNHTFFGNLKKESLQDIHERATKLRWFDHIHPRCLVTEEKFFMDKYFEGLDKSENGYVHYSYWLENEKNSNKK